MAGYDTSSFVPDDVVQDVVEKTVLRITIAVFTLGLLASVTDVPSYLNPLVEAAIVLDILRTIYRLNTWTPQLT